MWHLRRIFIWFVSLSGLLLTSCQHGVQELSAVIVTSFPHDTTAYTQGLLMHKGRLLESTGLRGSSSLREVNLTTGNVERFLPLDQDYFGEGLARVGDHLIQLTWQRGTAFVYDLETFEAQKTFQYEGEGWGLCHDGKHLFMTDGTSTLFRRNASTFEEERTVIVTLRNKPIGLLNELECVGEHVFANIWQTDNIIRINKHSGKVTAVIDASGLLTPNQKAALLPGEVLNGIAYNQDTENFFVTGKNWPALFEVRWVVIAP
jgi:glutamine cyclotransferase